MIAAIVFAILWVINQIWMNPVLLFVQGIFAAVLFIAVAEEFSLLEKENTQLKISLETQNEKIERLKLKVEKFLEKNTSEK